jgi:hypothetical protein
MRLHLLCELPGACCTGHSAGRDENVFLSILVMIHCLILSCWQRVAPVVPLRAGWLLCPLVVRVSRRLACDSQAAAAAVLRAGRLSRRSPC